MFPARRTRPRWYPHGDGHCMLNRPVARVGTTSALELRVVLRLQRCRSRVARSLLERLLRPPKHVQPRWPHLPLPLQAQVWLRRWRASMWSRQAEKCCVPKLPPLSMMKSSPVAPPPSVMFTSDRAPPVSVTVPPGAFRFFFGWIPLADPQGRTFWWNTVTNETTYDYPTHAADELPRMRSG